MRRLDSGPRAQVHSNHVTPGPQLGFGGFVRSFPMDPVAMQAKIGDLEAFLATVTGALQQLSTQHIVHSPPKPPKPPKPDKFLEDRRSGAASKRLHQMTLYLTLLKLPDTAHALPNAAHSCLLEPTRPCRSFLESHARSHSSQFTFIVHSNSSMTQPGLRAFGDLVYL